MVVYNKKTCRSGRALADRLDQEGYDGPTINWGNSHAWSSRLEDDNLLNSIDSVGQASNKRVALQTMRDNDVPVALTDGLEFPLVGRPDYHSQGRWLRYLENMNQLEHDKRVNRKHPTTHYQRFIANAREFRVHVVKGESIKISEKVSPDFNARVKNHRFGAKCVYPHNFNHKKSLRRIAKEAVECLGLDFGAADILWREDIGFIVLEVNSAPCLTDTNSDTLERYVKAFMVETV